MIKKFYARKNIIYPNTYDYLIYISVYGDSDVITNPDDLLPPIAKLEKYAESDNIFNRSAQLIFNLH